MMRRWFVLFTVLVVVSSSASSLVFFQDESFDESYEDTFDPVRQLQSSSTVPEFFPCPICTGGAAVAHPQLIIGNSSNNNHSITCADINQMGQNSSFDSFNCGILQVTNLQATCGCPTAAPTQAPFTSCNICGNNDHLVITNFDQVIDLPELFGGNITCLELQNMGTSFGISSLTCSILPNITFEACGCQTVPTGNDACDTATSLSLGQVVLGQTYSSLSNSTNVSSSSTTTSYLSVCAITVNTWSWYTFVGTGAIVTAHTCHYTALPTQVLVSNGPSCHTLNCTMSSYEECVPGNAASGTATTWYADANVTYRILVAGGNVQSAPISSTFALVVATACNICGGFGKRATNLNAMVQVPLSTSSSTNTTLTMNMTCFDLQRQAMFGLILNDASSCLNVQADIDIQQACGCAFFVPGPDRCSNAMTIVANELIHGSTTALTTTNGSTTIDNLSNYGTFPSTRAWYRYVGTGDMVTADTCTYVEDYINGITIFNGTTSCHMLELLSDGQPGCDTNSYGASASWFAELHQEYYILVAGDPSLFRTFILQVTVEPPSPTMAPTTSNHTVCNICGVDGVTPIYALQGVYVPGLFGNTTCGNLELLGSNGAINASTCAALLATNIPQQACGCYIPGPTTCDNATVVTLNEPSFGRVLPEPSFTNYTYCGEMVSDPVWYRFDGVGDNVTASVQSCTAALIVLEESCAQPFCIGADMSACNGYQQHVPQVTWYAAVNQPYFLLVSTDTFAYPEVEADFVLTVTTSAHSSTHTYTPEFPKCDICGSNVERVTLTNASIGNSYSSITCAELEQSGLTNKIAPAVCSVLLEQGLYQTCGCQVVTTNSNNETFSPSSVETLSPSAAFATFVPSQVASSLPTPKTSPKPSAPHRGSTASPKPFGSHPSSIASVVSSQAMCASIDGVVRIGERDDDCYF